MALTGYVDCISRSGIEGWAMDDLRPGQPVSLSIHVDGVHRGTSQTVLLRSDIATAGESARCGFHFRFDPPLSPFAGYRIEVKETWSAETLPNGERTLPRPHQPKGRAKRHPIFITSTGRSGTTLLMSEFARSPDIVGGGEYPFDIKQLAYYAAAFRALAGDADRDRSTNPDTMLASEQAQVIGSNPYNQYNMMELRGSVPVDGEVRDFYESTVPARYAALFRSLMLDFYDVLANAQGKKSARYFCEKGDTDEIVGQGARLFFGQVREIVVVRDPRDLMCSSMAFWNLTASNVMQILRTSLPRLARLARDAAPDTIILRYEDLIRDPVGTRRALSEFLDLDLLSRTGTADQVIPSSHRTSEDPASSIGRWRRDLPPDLIAGCEAAFAPFMRDFDYALAGGADGHRSGAAARRFPRAGNLVVAAEGAHETVAFLENTELEGEDGSLSRQVLNFAFGEGGDGVAFLGAGWSGLEPGYVWTDALESHVTLPAVRQEGEYQLHIAGLPFTHEDVLPFQRVTVLIDGQEAGVAELRTESVLVANVPAEVVRSGGKLLVTLRVATAARPTEINGVDDDRLLGFALRHIAVFRAAGRWDAVEPPEAEPGIWEVPDPVPAREPMRAG